MPVDGRSMQLPVCRDYNTCILPFHYVRHHLRHPLVEPSVMVCIRLSHRLDQRRVHHRAQCRMPSTSSCSNATKLNAQRIAMLSGLLAGTMLICLTPFNLYRFIIGHSGNFSLHSSLMSIFSSLSSMTNIRIAFLLVIMAVLLKVSRHVTKTEARDFIKRHSIIITACKG